jgi:hypothetical protein
VADVDIVVTAGEIHTGAEPDGDIVVPGCVVERNVADSGIERAGEVAIKRISTKSRIFMTGGVAESGLNTANFVLIACGVVIQGKEATSCIKIPDGIPE